MKLLILLGALMMSLPTFAHITPETPDTNVNVIDKAKIQTWMADARHKMFEKDWRGALAGFREVLQVDKTNAKAEYRIAECQYELMVYPFALEHLNKAKELKGPDISKEYYFVKGKIHQRLGQLDEAIKAFSTFKEVFGPEKAMAEPYVIEKWITDCEYAKRAMQSPLNVEVTGLGEAVNGRFRDYGPVLSPDGKKLYFTSRRNDTYGGNVAGDQVFYSDIYVSKWDDAKGTWGEAKHPEGKLNTEEFDAITHFHVEDDGDEYIYATYNVWSFTKSSDIGYSKRSSKGTWSKPKLEQKLKGKKGGINTTYFESSATLDASGNTMYFVAESPKGIGLGDIYVVKKDGNKWGTPQNLGATVNTKYDENTVWVTPDGNTLFFSTDGRDGMGGYDIYKTTKTGDTWSDPVNVGYPINSVNNDTHFRLSPDGKTGYMTSARQNGFGLHDIYMVDLKGLDLIK